jgi:hypothetical protein
MRKLFLVLLFSCIVRAQSTGTFNATGTMIAARARHTATLVPDGRVLIAGGENSSGALASAELYDPRTSTFTATGNMTAARTGHAATLLPDGRVLIVGGSGLISAELYDSSTGTFSPTGSMIAGQPSFSFSATLMANGKVLITGGSAPELYDPSTGQFVLAGPYARVYSTYDFGSTATLLPNGKVLFAADPLYSNFGAELYDPVTNAFGVTGVMVSNIVDRTATLLVNGKVLLAGGDTEESRFKQAELYDPASGAFSATADMTEPRNNHAAVVLGDGKVLITGGEGWGTLGGQCCLFLGSLASAELYDASTGVFSSTGSMIARRELHTATVLNDGRVLITGGLYYGGIAAFYGSLSSAEIYTPTTPIAAPALFSVSGDGQGQAAIWNAITGNIASSVSPATAGDVVSLYTTGLAPGGAIPPQVLIGGRLGDVLYFGDAPGYPGYFQVNVRVPSGVAPGQNVSVSLSYLDRSSNKLTIAIQ